MWVKDNFAVVVFVVVVVFLSLENKVKNI